MSRMDPHDENVLIMTGNKAHHQRRAHLLAGYGGKGMDNQEQLVDEQIEKLIALVNRDYLSTKKKGYGPAIWPRLCSILPRMRSPPSDSARQ